MYVEKSERLETSNGSHFFISNFKSHRRSDILIMDIKGRVIQLLALQTGEGKNGTWKKQDFVIETDGQYPKKICISAWGDKINESALQVGNEVNVSFDVESREYNGRWYTDVKAWKIDALGAGGYESAPVASGTGSTSTRPTTELPSTFQSGDEDNLPF